MTCVTGVSGSGKSSLVNEILFKSLSASSTARACVPATTIPSRAWSSSTRSSPSTSRPIGRTPRSNPATYTGVFDLIRDVSPPPNDARARGYKPNASASNVKGGRCEPVPATASARSRCTSSPTSTCPCEVCGGKRYNRETLEVRYKGKNIYEVLEMTVDEALEFFTPAAAHRRQIADFAGCRPWLRQARPALDHALRRRGARASNWPRSFPARPRAAPSTCWTSRPRACTSPTWKSSIRYSTALAERGTRWW